MKLPADPRARLLVAVLGALLAFVFVLVAIDRLSPSPQGPPSSSYATSPGGLAAYAALLERAGHPVRRLRTAVAEEPPRADETLFVLDPSAMEPAESVALAGWVKRGGRLVAGASGEVPWLSELFETGDPPVSVPGATRHLPLAPVAETTDVREVRSAGAGGWRGLGGLLPVIGPADGPLVVTARVERGTVALLADSSPLTNGHLARADNAALGLALIGGARKPVAFLETVHGYGVARGLGGLPANIKWALLGLALTGLVAVWSAGRRFGPPEDQDTPLPPPRIEYVDALAGALVRAKPDKEPPK